MTSEADERRARRSQGDEPSDAGGVVVLGLLAPPQMPAEVVEDLAAELPGALSERMGDRVSWKVPTVRDAGAPDVDYGGHEGIGDVREWGRKEGWDLAVCVTDLLLHGDGRVLVAEASAQRDAAMVSLPALGPIRRRARALEAIVVLVEEIFGEGVGLGRGGAPRPRRLAGIVAPLGRLAEGGGGGGAQLVAPAVLGQLRLLAGMVRATHPFRTILGLSYALAVSFATGAYALVTPSIWQLGDAFGWERLLAFMAVSVAAIVAWLIVVHDLWERPSGSGRDDREQALLFNATTVITLTIGALSLYAALFALIFVVSGIFVPEGFLRSTLGHPVGPVDYVILTWMASSVATVAGALGSGLESSADVREAYYGYHRERHGGDGDGSG